MLLLDWLHYSFILLQPFHTDQWSCPVQAQAHLYLVVSASTDTNRLIFIFIFFNISYTLYGNLQVYLIAALDEVVH